MPDGVVPLAVGELARHSPVLRDTVEDAGVAYLGVVAAQRDDRSAVIVLAIAITVMEFPAGTDPASLVAATLRRAYPRAVVEEFTTASGTGVGMQRREHDRGSGAAVCRYFVPFAGDWPPVPS